MIDPETIDLVPTGFDIVIPYNCDPNAKFPIGQIVRVKGNYWQAKWHGKLDNERYTYPHEALIRLIKLAETAQEKMLADSWKKFVSEIDAVQD